jgi:hypothetical protein
MQARMKNPAMIVPGAMQELQALGKSAEQAGKDSQQQNSPSLFPYKIRQAAQVLAKTTRAGCVTLFDRFPRCHGTDWAIFLMNKCTARDMEKLSMSRHQHRQT